MTLPAPSNNIRFPVVGKSGGSHGKIAAAGNGDSLVAAGPRGSTFSEVRGRSILKDCRGHTVLWLFAFAMLWPSLAPAHGAVAVGIPDSVANDGFSIGMATDAPTADMARVESLRACLDSKTAPAKARGLCRVVTTFSRQCVSIAHDPGGAGWGWAVERTIAEAQTMALRSCKSTVSKSCVIAHTHCDRTP